MADNEQSINNLLMPDSQSITPRSARLRRWWQRNFNRTPEDRAYDEAVDQGFRDAQTGQPCTLFNRALRRAWYEGKEQWEEWISWH